jgi:hypothetical protein
MSLYPQRRARFTEETVTLRDGLEDSERILAGGLNTPARQAWRYDERVLISLAFRFAE